MAVLSFLLQVVGVCSGLYLIFSQRFGDGLALIALVAIGHFTFIKLSNLLIQMSQRKLNAEELHELGLRAQFGIDAAPTGWVRIANVCALLYCCFMIAIIWFFFQR
jgi:hypothetical protein